MITHLIFAHLYFIPSVINYQFIIINNQLSIHHHQQSFINSFTDFPYYQTTPSSFSPSSCSSTPSAQSPLSSLCTGSTFPSSNSHPHAELIKQLPIPTPPGALKICACSKTPAA
jgi:hypothetical protein